MCFLILLKFPIAIINIFYDNNKARYKRICGVAVNMSPCHGEDRGFDSRQIRQRFIIITDGSVAQLVEHQTENLSVAGALPA